MFLCLPGQALRSVAEDGYKVAAGVAEQVRASQRDIGRGVRGMLALLGHRQLFVQEAACTLAQANSTSTVHREALQARGSSYRSYLNSDKTCGSVAV